MNFQDMRIKYKLIIVTGALLLLVAVAISIFFPMRQEAQAGKFQSQKALAISRIMAKSSEAGLNFGDPSAVTEVLQSLKEIEDVQFAIIYGKEGKQFAQYGSARAGSVKDLMEKAICEDSTPASSSARNGIRYFSNGAQLVALAPILSNGKQLGTVALGIDQSELRKDVASSRFWAFGAGILILGLGSLIFSIVASKIVEPLKQMENAARRIARGDIDFQIDIQRRDEIGVLAESFRELVRYFQNVAAAAEALSQGRLDAQVTAESKKDVLSSNLIALRTMMEETRGLIRQAQEGRLGARGQADKFQGVYRGLVEAINQMMDVIVLPINEASATLQAVARRDLRVRMKGTYQGDYAKMKNDINTAVANLDTGLIQISSHAAEVVAGSSQIKESSQEFSAAASEQSETLQLIAGNLNDMSHAIHQNSASAKRGKELATGARLSSDRGSESMRRLSDAIDRIKTSSDATAHIIKTIDDIAFQTNLLALNAAVEAARAGESGKGFSVVAEEVRNLAMRSADAARHTAEMIEESVRNAESGVEINREAMENLEEINSQVNLVSNVMLEIVSSSEQQQRGVENVLSALNRLNSMTEQYVSKSGESVTIAEALSGQAEAMQDLVTTFQLSADQDFQDAPNYPVPPRHFTRKSFGEAIL